MEYLAKIIHKTHISYLPTSYAVQFYGMPNGKVIIVYARDCKAKTSQEFVFAEHKEFSYDYHRGKLMLVKNNTTKRTAYPEMIDKPDPQYTIFRISGKISSYIEAFNAINRMAGKMISEDRINKTITLNDKREVDTDAIVC